jgi:ferric-dicitrate binding protein FerR (iron transport regulator)
MSNTPNHPTEDAEFARLFDHAASRPRPDAAAQAAAFDKLHRDWQQVVQQRRRRRSLPRFALAASVLLAVAVVVGVVMRPALEESILTVAAVARVEGGEVSWRDENSPGQRVPADIEGLRVGQRLSTGASSRVALAWHDGGSLRVDEHTRIEFSSAHSVRLVTGSLYFDSAATPTSGAANPGALSIQTQFGEVLHVGTQFMMRVEGDEVALSVREGQVIVTGDGFELVVNPGEELHLGVDGQRSRRTISGYDESWNWVRDIAPRMPIEGRTAFDILAWAARETGRRLIYASADAETLARETIIRGVEERTPDDALEILPYFTDLKYEVRADAIVLSAR